jgi:hypothetical protein
VNVVDPGGYFGIDSGMRQLRVNERERTTLLRAAEILERGHDLFTAAAGPDHQGDYEDAGDALCTAPAAIRRLATEGIEVA